MKHRRRLLQDENYTDRPDDWRKALHTIIYEADTPLGFFFDIGLLAAILTSVLLAILESVSSLQTNYGKYFLLVEWVFTILFTVEYLLRIISIRKPLRYIFSFFGIVDFLSILPTYLSGLMQGSHYFLIIRSLRLLRVFRILKLGRYIGEAGMLVQALSASRYKITVFLFAVLSIASIIGTLMYIIEGPESGFTSIPTGIYWAIVTLTTVGYGDIYPVTVPGKFLSTLVMILGYGVLAVPTGIVSAELSKVKTTELQTTSCPACSASDHDADAQFCKHCGEKL